MANPEEKINTLSDKIKISFILLFILFGFPPSLCFLSRSRSRSLSLSSIDIGSFLISVEVLGAPGTSHSTGRSLVVLTLWGSSIKIIRYFPRMLILSLWPAPIALAQSILSSSVCNKADPCNSSSSLPVLASTCVWKEILDQLQLSHRPRTKNPTTNDELGLKPAKDAEIPRPVIVYTHTRQINREKMVGQCEKRG